MYGKIISITGPSGVGKSTVARQIQEKTGWKILGENAHNNPFLSALQAGNDTQYIRWMNQWNFLRGDMKQLGIARDIADSGENILLDFHIHQVRNYAELLLTGEWRERFLSSFAQLSKDIIPPDYTLVLEADANTIISRRQQRGKHIDERAAHDTQRLIDMFGRDAFPDAHFIKNIGDIASTVDEILEYIE